MSVWHKAIGFGLRALMTELEKIAIEKNPNPPYYYINVNITLSVLGVRRLDIGYLLSRKETLNEIGDEPHVYLSGAH